MLPIAAFVGSMLGKIGSGRDGFPDFINLDAAFIGVIRKFDTDLGIYLLNLFMNATYLNS